MPTDIQRLMRTYGNPGTVSAPNLTWRSQNVIMLTLPWPMLNAYTGHPVTMIYWHHAGARSLLGALNSVWAAAEDIVRAGQPWQTMRKALKAQKGFGHTPEFYDNLMKDDTARMTRDVLAGFGGHIFGGSYVHRAQRGSGVLSTHALAIALDINPNDNPMGAPLRTTFPDWYVQAFEDHGFTWGGRWERRPDAMHFELS